MSWRYHDLIKRSFSNLDNDERQIYKVIIAGESIQICHFMCENVWTESFWVISEMKRIYDFNAISLIIQITEIQVYTPNNFVNEFTHSNEFKNKRKL